MSDAFQPASIGADGTRRAAMPVPRLDPESALLFVINATAGALDVDAKRAVIESTLAARGRRGELLVCAPDELAHVAAEAAVCNCFSSSTLRDSSPHASRRMSGSCHSG